MAGVFGVSIDRGVYKERFPDLLWLGTFYQQPQGEANCGISLIITEDGIKRFWTQNKRGHFRHNFDGQMNPTYTDGIGYCGDAREPFQTHSRLGAMSLCFAGNITNRAQLADQFEIEGHLRERGEADDIEVIALLLASSSGTLLDGVAKLADTLKGAYSLLILKKDQLIAHRSPDGHWPLAIGQRDGVTAVSSGTGGFCNLGLNLIREVNPGETVVLKSGKFETVYKPNAVHPNFCSFVWFYTASPTSVFENISAGWVRKRSGIFLAKKDIANGFIPDIVAPVPDSGKCAAMGYHQAYCDHVNRGLIKRVPLYDELTMKFPYSGRSFTPPTKGLRDQEALLKLLVSESNNFPEMLMFSSIVDVNNIPEDGTLYIDIVFIDDSLVRGTQTAQNLIPKVKKAAALLAEAIKRYYHVTVGGRLEVVVRIHLRFSFPKLLSHCPWGKTTQEGELLAVRIQTDEEIAKHLGVTSVGYNEIGDVAEIIGLPYKNLCTDCARRR